MANTQIIANYEDIVAIADAVRNKTGSNDEMSFSDIISEINEYECGTATEDAIINCTITEYANNRITNVKAGIFQNCTAFTSANLPNVVTIGSNAFSSCYSLVTINSPKVTSIGDFAFANCHSLSSVSFPNVVSIGSEAFYNCSLITEVNFSNVTELNYYVFSTCSSLTTANLPNVTKIGPGAFYYCGNLTNLTVSPNLSYIDGNAFAGCNLKTMDYPEVTYLGDAFRYCHNLTNVNFPKITEIVATTFGSCYSLNNVNFPLVTSIGNYAFENCSSLTSMSFPETTYIGERAFYNCISLATASFPKATTIYSNSTFAKCFNLKSLYLLASSLCTLGKSTAFSSTPIGGYTTSAGTYGSIYVPYSMLNKYKTATNWTYFSSRFVAFNVPTSFIAFTIDGTEYQTENGLTWIQWCNSDYNTDGYHYDNLDDCIYDSNWSYYICDSNNNMEKGSNIIEAKTYITQSW